jgi:hypothetical protein
VKARRSEGPKDDRAELNENLNLTGAKPIEAAGRDLRSLPWTGNTGAPVEKPRQAPGARRRVGGVCGTHDRKRCTKN